jgi:hypothetical protein
MQSFGKVLAAICAVMLVITGVLALFLYNIERTAFRAQTYKLAFERQQIYEKMPSVLATALTQYVAGNPNADPFLKTLTQADWEKTVVLLVPPQELRTQTDATLDSIFDYLNGKSDSAAISLAPFKNHLAGPEGVEAVKLLLQAQPPCTADQLLQLGMGLLQGDIGLCNPPEQLMGAMTPLLESQLRVMVLALPDSITLIPSAISSTAGDPRLPLRRARTLMKLTLILPFLSLIGLVIFTARSMVDMLKWTGAALIVTGGISALIALLSSPTLNLILMGVFRNRAAFLPPVILATLQEAIGAVSQQILDPVVLQGALLVMTGIVMLIIVLYLSTRGKSLTLT